MCVKEKCQHKTVFEINSLKKDAAIINSREFFRGENFFFFFLNSNFLKGLFFCFFS